MGGQRCWLPVGRSGVDEGVAGQSEQRDRIELTIPMQVFGIERRILAAVIDELKAHAEIRERPARHEILGEQAHGSLGNVRERSADREEIVLGHFGIEARIG